MSKVPTPENILEIRKALETAGTTLETLRIGQSAPSWMIEQIVRRLTAMHSAMVRLLSLEK